MLKIEKLVKTAPVYDVTVKGNENFYANGVLVHNCGEILLRDREFCNLSEAIVRATDTPDDLERKVRIAALIGTLQSTLTDFKYISKRWQQNCEEERLLGVSLTGIMDSDVTNGKKKGLPELLQRLRQAARDENERWSDVLGVSVSKAVTTVKPSGTVSSLVDSAPGIHPRFARRYARRVRMDNKDPLLAVMVEAGFHVEPDVMAPNHTSVITFPIEAPKTAVTKDDVTAIDQLELWLIYREHWCDHNPSVTVNVREHEWMSVGAWVYGNFDKMTGVSFLPHSDHTYKQAPYEEIDASALAELFADTPKSVDWHSLEKTEKTDTTVGSQELACTSATGCEI